MGVVCAAATSRPAGVDPRVLSTLFGSFQQQLGATSRLWSSHVQLLSALPSPVLAQRLVAVCLRAGSLSSHNALRSLATGIRVARRQVRGRPPRTPPRRPRSFGPGRPRAEQRRAHSSPRAARRTRGAPVHEQDVPRRALFSGEGLGGGRLSAERSKLQIVPKDAHMHA